MLCRAQAFDHVGCLHMCPHRQPLPSNCPEHLAALGLLLVACGQKAKAEGAETLMLQSEDVRAGRLGGLMARAQWPYPDEALSSLVNTMLVRRHPLDAEAAGPAACDQNETGLQQDLQQLHLQQQQLQQQQQQQGQGQGSPRAADSLLFRLAILWDGGRSFESNSKTLQPAQKLDDSRANMRHIFAELLADDLLADACRQLQTALEAAAAHAPSASLEGLVASMLQLIAAAHASNNATTLQRQAGQERCKQQQQQQHGCLVDPLAASAHKDQNMTTHHVPAADHTPAPAEGIPDTSTCQPYPNLSASQQHALTKLLDVITQALVLRFALAHGNKAGVLHPMVVAQHVAELLMAQEELVRRALQAWHAAAKSSHGLNEVCDDRMGGSQGTSTSSGSKGSAWCNTARPSASNVAMQQRRSPKQKRATASRHSRAVMEQVSSMVFCKSSI